MSGTIPPLPQYAFMAWCSVKAQGQIYLYLSSLRHVIFMQDILESGKKYNGKLCKLSILGYLIHSISNTSVSSIHEHKD
jgi:hypothetical protein